LKGVARHPWRYFKGFDQPQPGHPRSGAVFILMAAECTRIAIEWVFFRLSRSLNKYPPVIIPLFKSIWSSLAILISLIDTMRKQFMRDSASASHNRLVSTPNCSAGRLQTCQGNYRYSNMHGGCKYCRMYCTTRTRAR